MTSRDLVVDRATVNSPGAERPAGGLRWDPAQYLRFGGARAQPFLDLLSRVEHPGPRHVADLGCGPGTLTALLSERWPEARVMGVDSSAEMLAAAQRLARPGQLAFRQGDLREWQPALPVDVIVSNATLQWVPEHLELLPRLQGALAPGGVLALQLPANFDQPSHQLLSTLRRSPRWRERVGDGAVRGASVHEPQRYLDVLSANADRVEVWETTYLHVLPGQDAVLQWMRGTGLRPVLSVLDQAEREEFEAAYAAALRVAYPSRPYGTVLPYRRIFAVASRGER